MATMRLMLLHTGKGRNVGTAISDIIDYAENPEKTDYGRLITGYECDSRTADAEFLFSKRQYATFTDSFFERITVQKPQYRREERPPAAPKGHPDHPHDCYRDLINMPKVYKPER